jgi:carboxyl-terminal processing protease
MLKGARKIIERRQADETRKLAAALAALGVDWAAPPRSREGKAALTASFQVRGKAGEIHAGDELELVGTVTNSGNEPAYRVHARVRSDDRVFRDTELVFGMIEPGQSKSWTAHIKVPEDALDRLDYLTFDIDEARGVEAKVDPLKLRVVAAERPVFAYAHQLIDESNGDGLVQEGERHRLRVTIKNIGKGIAKETTAILRNASGTDVLLRKARFEIGELGPGQEQTVEFEFETAPRLRTSEVVVEMTVYDSRLRESVVEKLKYPVHRPSAGPGRQVGSVRVQRDQTPIHEGASPDSVQIGRADRGAMFALTGKLGDWLRVELDRGRPGFVRAAAVRATDQRSRLAAFERVWQVTPPSLALEVPSYEVRGDRYRLRGTATDDNRVEDVYIFVSNQAAKIENRKVFYRSNRGARKANVMAFSPEIPLWPGSNLVTVVARENGDVKSSRTLYIYRQDDQEATASTR